MNFELPEEVEAIRNVAQSFAEKEIASTVMDDDNNHYFRYELVEKMGKLGLFGSIIPEEYGGNEAGYLACVAIVEEISKVSASMSTLFNTQSLGPPYALLRWGNEEQKRKYIPPLVRGEKICSFAITEPNTGSDVAGMKSTAKRDGNYYVLNGSKMWITYAPIADFALVYVYTDLSLHHRGMSCFIVEKDTPGFTTRTITSKFGLRSIPTGEVTFEECRVPKENLLGQEGEGFKICMAQLEGTRLGAAARGVGIAAACLKTATEYARQRMAFNQPISSFQMIQEQIALMAVNEEAARLLVYKAAWAKDKFPKQRHTHAVAMAKYFAAEAAVEAANEAMKILGAYGYSEEYPVARYLRDAKSLQIVEGTSNIQKTLIARGVLEI
ncbi:acyl-CoA dehydrogenase family protein [Paradesulfitobacterium ferrireducens]|uniref:acyl-CoA dehydrogenase family protein n=1 Tax=Paradesulfitobacterium ferrireducens TaxID=2816476 RepID=UPI001A8F55F8|nr:acyl-CoA dehydrogenase family protein [Paradesulfitobacterium ferrireducens]